LSLKLSRARARVKKQERAADERRAVTTTISQPVRIAVLLGLAAALALGGMFMLIGRKSTPTTVPTTPVHRHTVSSTTKPRASSPTEPAVKPATKPVAPVSTRPAAEVAALQAGLPVPLARALGRHSVVLVELTDPQSEVDGIALGEARAGAAMTGAGFVALNVLSKDDVGKLTRLLGQVLPDPGLFVYTRPARLAARFSGFVDKQTAAQAALNAASGS
jgi:hypothetical protein